MSRSLVPLSICLLALAPGSFLAGDKAQPSDLGFVPPDAIGFVHVRLGDVWKSEQFKEWRNTVLKAGERMLSTFDKRFFPTPSSLERVTIFAMPPADGQERNPDGPFVIVATSKAIDKEEFLKHTVPGADEVKTANGTLIVDGKRKTEIHFLDDRTFVFGPAGAVRKLLARPRPAKGNLSEALKLAQSRKPVVIALNPQALPAMASQTVPPPLRPLLKAKMATLALDLGEESQISLSLHYADADDTSAAEESIKEGIKLARTFIVKGRHELEKRVVGDGQPGSLDQLPEAAASLFGLGLLNRVDEYLTSSPIKKEGDSLHLAVKLPQGAGAVVSMGAIGAALLVPAVQKVRDAASRVQGMNNLKQMALAMHNYHDVNKSFPPAAICDANGKPLLSWRVAILPYIEQDQLYRQFKLDEPWNSEHNRKLISRMPAIYAVPAAPGKPGETHYRVLVGGGAGFDLTKGPRLADIADGTSNTIMIVEAADSVPWTKPDELVYDAKKPLPRFGNFHGNDTFSAALFDGSVRTLSSKTPEQTLRALITRAGFEAIGNDGQREGDGASSKPGAKR